MRSLKSWVLATLILMPFQSFALDQIVRPYQSVRSAGMGGVRMTTGLYEDNFFNNPARVTANPRSKFTLFKLSAVEVNKSLANTESSIANSSDVLNTISGLAGENMHARIQLVLPAFYIAANEDRKWAVGFGVIGSFQADADVRQSYQTSFGGYLDVGPALTIGRKYLADDSLSVGFTGHLMYRLATDPNYTLEDYISGRSPGINSIGGEGSMFDFDIGATYRIGDAQGFNMQVGAAMQNILGGKYNNVSFRPLKLSTSPPVQPRSVGLGISVSNPSLLIFSNPVVAFEITDVFNNQNGSLYRLLHIGGELEFLSIFTIRGGINQGYLTAGVGLDLRILTVEVSTYGEEMGLNAGTLEDRRYAAAIALQI